MITLKKDTAAVQRVMWMAVAMELLAAVSYVLIGLDVLGVGDLVDEEAPAAITYVAAGSYLIGGLLILLRRRWLWILGAVINFLVMFTFFRAYQDRPEVLYSPGGVATKAGQLLLEFTLIYLIIAETVRRDQGTA